MQNQNIQITEQTTLPLTELIPLLKISQEEGFEFIERLIQEYQNGVNRFDKSGEALFTIHDNQTLIAIGGINQDPYLPDTATGRIRHIYVLPAYRRQGIGKLLMSALITHAKGNFQALTLRTFTPQADQFYRHLGFKPEIQSEFATHILRLAP